MKIIRSQSFFILFFCFLALAKFILVAHNEIISIQDDSAVYASQSFGPWTLGYPPGYPIWLRFCDLFDIPQRLAIEGLYLFATFAVAYAVRSVFSTLAGLLTVGLLTIAPATYFLFDLGLTDGFFTSLSLIALAITILLFEARTLWISLSFCIGLGLVMGMMAITRNEDPLIALWLGMLLLILAFLWNREPGTIRSWKFWRNPLSAVALAGATAAGVVFTLCLSYYFSQHVFARGIALIPGHQQLLTYLAQIDTGQPQQRFVPISHRSRELAYSVSPTFAKLRPLVDDPQDGWQVISRQFGIPSGEIGGGWIWHAINLKVLAQVGNRPDLAEAEYTKMNSEIKAAFRDGRLKRRFILHPLLGGLPGLLTQLPASISAVSTSAFSSQPDVAIDQGYAPELFDRAFVRREILVPHSSDVTVQGWAFVNKQGGKIASVTVSSKQGGTVPILSQDRPDVVKVFDKQNGWKPNVVGFRATLKTSSPDDVTVTYTLDDGAQLQAQHLKAMQVSKVASASVANEDILQGIDVAGAPESQVDDRRHNLEHALFKDLQVPALHVVGAVICLLAFALATGLLLWQRDRRYAPVALFLGFGLLIWISRILFYSLIDARAWQGNQIRYLAPANVLGLVMFAVSVAALALPLKRRGIPGAASPTTLECV